MAWTRRPEVPSSPTGQAILGALAMAVEDMGATAMATEASAGGSSGPCVQATAALPLASWIS
jgi:hypothetical protein